MKLNWGHYIAIGFTLFVLLILSMVYRSFQHKNDLVSEDYYARELEYQNVIEKKKNAGKLDQDVVWTVDEKGLNIQFPEGMDDLQGSVWLYRPSDKDMDVKTDISTDDSGRQMISMDILHPGKYTIQVDWSSGGEEYYTEGVVFISK